PVPSWSPAPPSLRMCCRLPPYSMLLVCSDTHHILSSPPPLLWQACAVWSSLSLSHSLSLSISLSHSLSLFLILSLSHSLSYRHILFPNECLPISCFTHSLSFNYSL